MNVPHNSTDIPEGPCAFKCRMNIKALREQDYYKVNLLGHTLTSIHKLTESNITISVSESKEHDLFDMWGVEDCQCIGYYHYDEERMLPTWEIVQDKKEIAGYICQKASTNYLGREWIVYFTPEIPINQGPWKLWGLPGLIVEARDKDNLFSFELDGFEVVKKEVPILYKNADSTGKLYTAISKKKFQELEKLYYKDFLEYLKVFVMDGKGSLHQTKEQKQQYQKHKRKGGIL